MTEDGLRAVTLLQAFETAQPPSPAWSEADRRWATRAARELAGDGDPIGPTSVSARTPHGGPARRDPARGQAVPASEAGKAGQAGKGGQAGEPGPAGPQRGDAAGRIEARAWLGLQRLAAREPAVEAALPASAVGRGNTGRRPPGERIAFALLLGVPLVAGIAADTVGAGRRIDLLAPPLWGVVAWNLAVYLGLVVALLYRPRPGGAGPWRRGLVRLRDLAVGSMTFQSPGAGSEPAWRLYRRLWADRSAPLWGAAAGAWLHAAAAAFALGLVAGLYLRGLVLDYRAGWESTFLDAGQVRGALGLLLAPALRVDGIPLPDLAAIAAMRMAHGSEAGGAPAAAWIHLLATTLVLLVVLPRLLLAGFGAARLAVRRTRLALPIAGDPYLERLARELAGRAANAVVVPFACRPPPGAATLLAEALGDEFGEAPSVRVEAPVGHGEEDRPGRPVGPETTHLLGLFDLASIPEAEAHGRFVRALAATAAPLGASVFLVVDEGRFSRRFAGQPARLDERRSAWHRFASTLALRLVVVDLGGGEG